MDRIVDGYTTTEVVNDQSLHGEPDGRSARIRSALTGVDAADLQPAVILLQGLALPRGELAPFSCLLAAVVVLTAAARHRRVHGGCGRGSAVQRNQPMPAEEVLGAECDAAMDPDPLRVAYRRDFTREIGLLQDGTGLTVREVAARSGVPASTLGEYFAAPTSGRGAVQQFRGC